MRRLSHYQHSHQSNPFVTISEATLTHRIHSVHSLHGGSLLQLYILWLVSFLKILFALYLVAKKLADLGPHLCQVHWNHRPSYKVIMPMCDPILSSGRVPHGKCLHLATSVP